MADTQSDSIADLRRRLLLYRADRHPTEHATAQFHLGVALIGGDRAEEAVRVLDLSARMFEKQDKPLERAKAINMLGVAHRDRGDVPAACDAFRAAADGFSEGDLRLEEASARFNLGLARRDQEALDEARQCFEQARAVMKEAGAMVQSAAAARELGATLLSLDQPDEAADALEEAMDLAAEAGDASGHGSAANGLGVALLARGRWEAAVEALRTSVSANPRGVRPESYAMAKANLALAYEQGGDEPRARLAAVQALETPGAPGSVLDQATGLGERLGRSHDDLMVILDSEPVEQWPAVLRDELVRWTEGGDEVRRQNLGAWIDGHLDRSSSADQLSEAFVGVLLELPPESLEKTIASIVKALRGRPPEQVDRFRRDLSHGFLFFHAPQLLRLKDTFNKVAVELGEEPAWG